MEQLVTLHNKSDQMKEDLESIREIMNIMRNQVANWSREDHPDSVEANAEALGRQERIQGANTGNAE
eukprot:15977020-Heterocapsa_arctica.AAC.1